MSDHPLPQDEPYPATEFPLAWFKCMACFHAFVSELPVIYEKLPVCPACLAATQLERVISIFGQITTGL